MIPLYTQDQFDNAKSTDRLPFKCEYCNKIYFKPKKEIKYAIKINKSIKFCSKSCTNKAKTIIQIVTCKNCNINFQKSGHEIKKRPNHFCSYSCSSSYNNKHKKHGTKRSKLETYIQNQLIALYPHIEIHYNRKDAIQSELDIYIPSLKLAFELNGIFHREPIFGQDKLNQIQANDKLKFKACTENNITLCMIDTSKQKYFKESTSKEFLDIIIYHINWINLLANLPK